MVACGSHIWIALSFNNESFIWIPGSFKSLKVSFMKSITVSCMKGKQVESTEFYDFVENPDIALRPDVCTWT